MKRKKTAAPASSRRRGIGEEGLVGLSIAVVLGMLVLCGQTGEVLTGESLGRQLLAALLSHP